MKGDFSRDTFDQARHFSQVLMQQGRVQLDADWNEQASILLHYIQTLAADLIGPHAGPAGAPGFAIQLTNDNEDLTIGAGRYYVDGILCENEKDICYSNQHDYPLPGDHTLDLAQLAKDNGTYGVYLDVWERHITYLDDDHIREVALGGPDTATRVKVVWQVKITKPLDECNKLCERDWGLPKSDALMQARVDPGKPDTDPCITDPDAKYRGPENQLYRVEIHESSMDDSSNTKPWSFKWSRDNGSVAATVVKANGKDLTIYPARGFADCQWVELICDGQELRGEPGKMAKVVKVEGDVLTVETESVDNIPTKVRGWDHRAIGDVVLDGGAVKGEPEKWINLEHGVQVCFGEDATFRTGDYWLIPARVATGNIEWPLKGKEPEMLPPRGIQHHYAPLAILTRNGTGLTVNSCQCQFSPKIDCLDSSRSTGDQVSSS